ncbi:hypothetical protein GYMLUDRAFT_139042, partial [Collybiopsis luxurians FD-317 M1]
MPLHQPSEYLRSRCLLCFGGSKIKSIIVCLDACFTQKHNAQKSGCNPPRTHPQSFFIPKLEVMAWKMHVDTTQSSKESARPTKRKKLSKTSFTSDEVDHLEDGMQVPKSILDGCLASFTVADKAQVKGSTQFFDVMAQMAILC